jgi:GNAT superfamily N-acetyltransferase
MGLSVLTRELHANERSHLLAHLLALDAEDRHLRFAHMLSDDGIRHYVEAIDLTHDAVFVVTSTDLAIDGAAHLAREDGHAELGISVLSRSRGQGIGGALLARCAARARNWGMRVMFMNCLVENAAMMHLARKQGLKIAVSGAEAEAFVRLPRPIWAVWPPMPSPSISVCSTTPRNPIGLDCRPGFCSEDFRRRNSQQNRGTERL